MLNKNSWLYSLPSDVYTRLCECRNVKSDLPILVNARWAWMKDRREKFVGFTKEDALVYVLDLLDANSQYRLTELTVDEYNDLKGE